MIITFLTDFGLQDDFVGHVPRRDQAHRAGRRASSTSRTASSRHRCCRARSCSPARSHTCPRASTSRSSIPASVPSGRRSRSAAATGGSTSGPDNGLLVPAAERLGGVEGAWELENPAYRLEPVSRTFHGRDLFASGGRLSRGRARPGRARACRSSPAALVRLDVPAPVTGVGFIRAHVADRRPLRERPAQPDAGMTCPGRASSRARRSRSRSACSASTPARPRRSRTSASATSSSTRTRTGTSRSRSTCGNAAEMLAARPGDTLGITVRDGR